MKTLYHQTHDPEAPFFNFCHTLSIRYLRHRDAERLIVEPMTSMGVVLEKQTELLGRILDISMAHPSIVQWVCSALIERISRDGRRQIRLHDVDAVCHSSDFYSYYIETVLGASTPLEKVIALTLDKGSHSLEDIRQRLISSQVSPSYAELRVALEHLELFSVLREVGGRYSFLVTAFPEVAREALDVEAEIEVQREEVYRYGHPGLPHQ